MKAFHKAALLGVALFLPVFAYAQELGNILTTIGDLIGTLIPIAFALALLGFLWGLALYLLNFSGEDKDKKKGRDLMVYGIITLFVVSSVWGLVAVLQNTFKVPKTGPGAVPCVPGSPGCNT